MARFFPCPYLATDVELTDERSDHISQRHPGLSLVQIGLIAQTLAEPGLVMLSRSRATSLLFSRWYDELLDGKYLIVVVEQDEDGRRWIVTSHPSDIEIRGDVVWRRT